MIDRKSYVDKLAEFRQNGKIKVITGIRRCGKSVLLFKLFRDRLLQEGIAAKNIIELKLDRLQDYKYRNPPELLDLVNSKTKGRAEHFYLFVDELQFCRTVDYPETQLKVSIYDLLNDLRDRENLDVYVTGSNSRFLSSDIATEFRGRATQIHIWPLSFEEFHNYYGGDVRDNLNRYMLYGGMPELASFSNDVQKKEYLVSLFDEVYMKDIVERYGIERSDVFEGMLDLLSSSIGSLTNASKIADTLCSTRGIKINGNTVSSYINCMREAFLISEAKRYDVKGRRYFSYPSKYYFTDIGLRNARLNYRQFDRGYIMENIIYNELLRRGYSVDVGVVTDKRKSGSVQKEIDFVVNSGDKRMYIQSAYEILSEEKEHSELAPLMLTGDFFRKTIIENELAESYMDNNGILHFRLFEFLLNQNSISNF